jgi:hypothetical protein
VSTGDEPPVVPVDAAGRDLDELEGIGLVVGARRVDGLRALVEP